MRYTFLELLFSNRWQWVRKRSRCFWCKDMTPGMHWVKFTEEELRRIGDRLGDNNWEPDFDGAIQEDWRVK